MQIADYYDSVASFWDDDFTETKAARVVAATLSIPCGGACVLAVLNAVGMLGTKDLR